MTYENIHAVMEFTEVLKNEPEKAYDFISCNAYRFTKEGLTDILKELLYSLSYHVNISFYCDLYKNILLDVQKELDEEYKESYEEIFNDYLDKESFNMEKYFDIHVKYGEKDGNGYSIPIIANNEEEAKQKAINEKLFEYEDDINDIDYIEEITKEEYNEMKK